MKPVTSITYILKQFPFIYPARFIKSCREYIKYINANADEYSKTRRAQYYILENETDYFLESPKTIQSGYSHFFTNNQAFKTTEKCLFFLPDTYIYGDEGITLSNRNYLYEEFSHHFNISSLKKKILKQPFKFFTTHYKDINGTVASLLSPQSHNIYHWFFDVLSRIRLYGKVLDQIDYFLVSASVPESYLTLFDFFNIPASKIVRVARNEKLHCKYLYISSLPGSEGRSGFQDINSLRSALSLNSNPTHTGTKKFYLKRGEANSRRLINEAEIIENLVQVGFEVIEPGLLTLNEQVAHFREASIVISYHGAALFNLLFVPNNCKVVELFSTDYFRTDCFYTLSALLKLNYWYLVGDSSNNWGDCAVNPDLLLQTLKQMELQEGTYLSHE